MALTNAERQARWRERHRGEPWSNKALMAQLAALQARVTQLEAELTSRPQQVPRKSPGRDVVAALKQERDELAERLDHIEAYQPGIAAKTQAWIVQVDRT